jgi:hypothetical protein
MANWNKKNESGPTDNHSDIALSVTDSMDIIAKALSPRRAAKTEAKEEEEEEVTPRPFPSSSPSPSSSSSSISSSQHTRPVISPAHSHTHSQQQQQLPTSDSVNHHHPHHNKDVTLKLFSLHLSKVLRTSLQTREAFAFKRWNMWAQAANRDMIR